MVDRVTATVQNAIDSRHTRAKEKQVQDRAGSEFIRLTSAQANRLIAAPGTNTLVGLRDTALIALATGARAAELAALQVRDHRARTEDGALALLIRDGKGGKQRLVPYGALDFAVVIVESWLIHAGITEGSIFRGFWRGGRRVRQNALTVVAIENIVGAYPVVIEGERRAVKPHDLRRTYARLAWESGMQPVAIQQNLGHASLDTTLVYIGDLDTSHRQPGAFLAFNLGSLPSDPLT
jgi:site-specific recombinase XerD